MTDILRIIEPQDCSIDFSFMDRTETKAHLCKLDLMNCERSPLGTIASAEVFPQLESSLDAIASASNVLDISRAHSYLDKCAFDNVSLEAYSNSTLPFAAVPVSDYTSRLLESVLLGSFNPIATTEVFCQPQLSLRLIASAKILHQPLSSFHTASFDNDPSAPSLTTPPPKCATVSTQTKDTLTTTCNVLPLFVANTAVPAEHDKTCEGEALEKASLPSARLRQMWRHPRHRASR